MIFPVATSTVRINLRGIYDSTFAVLWGEKVSVMNKINSIIEKIWLERIPVDYDNRFLHREDSLKNAFYYHLRSTLGDPFLLQKRLRIFTEFHYGNSVCPNERADLAVIMLDKYGHISKVLAVIEFKYKSHGVSDRTYHEDVTKAVRYILNPSNDWFAKTHFYLAFINETSFERLPPDHRTYTTARQRLSATGRLTELLGYQENEASTWYCLNH